MPPFIREVKRKNKDGTVKIYYAEVESVREGNKVHQKYIRSLGSDPTKPSNYLLEPVHLHLGQMTHGINQTKLNLPKVMTLYSEELDRYLFS